MLIQPLLSSFNLSLPLTLNPSCFISSFTFSCSTGPLLALLPLLRFTANAQLLQYCSLSFSKSLTPPLDHSLVICSEEEGEEERWGRAHLATHAAVTHPRISSSQFSAPTVTQTLRGLYIYTGAWFITHCTLAWLRPLINPSSISHCPLRRRSTLLGSSCWEKKCLGPKLAYHITTVLPNVTNLHKTLNKAKLPLAAKKYIFSIILPFDASRGMAWIHWFIEA